MLSGRSGPLAAALAVVASILLAGAIVMINSLQTQMLFPINMVSPPGPLPRSAEPVEIASAGGTRLLGVHIPASSKGNDRTLILGFGGNAWNGSDVAAFLHELYPQADIVA